MKRTSAMLALLGSSATLVCCVLPAVLVTLGFGAAFAGFIGVFPQITWLSEHKALVFGLGGTMLALAGYFQWRNRVISCPTDPTLGEACKTTRNWSNWVFVISVGLYCLGGLFAFALPYFLT